MSQPTSVDDRLAAAYRDACQRMLTHCLERIRHCVRQLSEDQVWWRPHEKMNSIGNVILHLCGNLRQWVVAGVKQLPDTRDRPAEFAERGPVAKAELLARLEAVTGESGAALQGLTAAQWLEPRRIQGFDETVLSAVFDAVAHLNGHMQEIVYITRLQLGDRYVFQWVPATAEQGAPV